MFNVKNRAVIPEINRNDIIEDIHTGHLGITKCYERAKNSVHWFEISKDIERKVLRLLLNTLEEIQWPKEPSKH